MTNELIQAYTLGCLNPSEIRDLRKSIEGNPEFNLKELGKYQNLAALLPLMLPAEDPDPAIKEKVARKLYRLKNDLTSESSKVPGETAGINSTVKDLSKEIIQRSRTAADTGTSKYLRITGQSKPTSGYEEKKSREFRDIERAKPRLPFAKTKPVNIILLFSLIIAALITGLFTGYLIFHENNDDYPAEISSLKEQIEELNTESLKYDGLLNMLSKRDTRVYSLSGSEIYPDAFGRLYVNRSSGKAYLHVSGLPEVKDGSAYQLWLITSGTSYPLGIFSPENDSEYFYLNLPKIDYSNNIRVILTEEPASGSKQPGRRIFLTNEY